MKKTMLTLLALGMVTVGALWTFQGLGYVGGSAMTGVRTWAVIGPLVAGLGRCPAHRGDAPARQ